MNFIRCSLRRSNVPFLALRGFASSCKVLSASRRKLRPHIPDTLSTIYGLIENNHPSLVPEVLVHQLTKKKLGRPDAQKVTEKAVEVLLRRNLLLEAFKVDRIMRKEHFSVSYATRAKLLSAQLVCGVIRRKPFLHNIKVLFRKGDFQGSDGDAHVLDMLQTIALRDMNELKMMDEVANLYIESRGKGYRLDSRIVGFLVEQNAAAGRIRAARQWLDYHADRPPQQLSEDPEHCYPYATYVRARIEAKPESDPKSIYIPVLNRMARDFAWPNAVFMNVLISAELKRNNFDRALKFYDVLRSNVSQQVYPDQVTYAQLFAAARRPVFSPENEDVNTTQRPKRRRDRLASLYSVPPRTLFREMCELHALSVRGHITPHNPILTPVSLNAALLQFVVTEDYAGAIIALKMYDLARIPCDRRAVQSVIIALARRARQVLMSDGKLWTKIFLDLRGITIGRYKRVNNWQLTRRMLGVARRALSFAQKQYQEALREAKKRLKEANRDRENTELGESTPTPDKAPKLSMRAKKRQTMRSHRLALIDVLLSRALETTLLLSSGDDASERAFEAVQEAQKDMIPDPQKILSGKIDGTSFVCHFKRARQAD